MKWRVMAAIGFTSVWLTTVTLADTKSKKYRSMNDILAASKPTDWRPLDPENTLYLELPSGRVVIELAPAFAPEHIANIKTLAREHYFDGLAILRSQDNYVVQWGDAVEDDAAKGNTLKGNALKDDASGKDASGKDASRKEVKAKLLGTAKNKLPPEFTVTNPDITFTQLPDSDGYAPQVGFSQGFPAAHDPKSKQSWLTHCYGALGVARDTDLESGNGSGLYVVIGHAPRHLDRNIAVVGRVVGGMEKLSTLPRGTGVLGFYEKAEQRTPIISVRLASELPKNERTELEILRTDTLTWSSLVESRRNRHDDWYQVPAGHIELCNVPVPARLMQ